jgi:hypothetical protein
MGEYATAPVGDAEDVFVNAMFACHLRPRWRAPRLVESVAGRVPLHEQLVFALKLQLLPATVFPADSSALAGAVAFR